jgi:hypothetical protein
MKCISIITINLEAGRSLNTACRHNHAKPPGKADEKQKSRGLLCPRLLKVSGSHKITGQKSLQRRLSPRR